MIHNREQALPTISGKSAGLECSASKLCMLAVLKHAELEMMQPDQQQAIKMKCTQQNQYNQQLLVVSLDSFWVTLCANEKELTFGEHKILYTLLSVPYPHGAGAVFTCDSYDLRCTMWLCMCLIAVRA